MSSRRLDLVLDADVLMNLLATDRLEEVLDANGVRGLICPRTRAEAIYLDPRVPGGPREAIDLAPHIASGTLAETSLGDDEVATYVRFAVEVDDGEAQVLAVGLHRGLAVATDDRRASGVVSRERVELRGTADLILEWAQSGGPSAEEQRQAVMDIETRARFRPRLADPMRAEWDRLRSR